MEDLAREALVSKLLMKEQKKVPERTMKELLNMEKVATAGVTTQESLSKLLWEGLQMASQHDLAVKKARENAYEGQLTTHFQSNLKSKVKDVTVCREKDIKDMMLHPELDKLAAEESKTNRKLSLLIKSMNKSYLVIMLLIFFFRDVPGGQKHGGDKDKSSS